MSFGLLSKGKNPQCIQGAAAAHGLVALAYIGFCVCVYTHLYKGSILYAEPGTGAQWPISWTVPPLSEKLGYRPICAAV